jgi:pimeloyl-ACP methyl ester carboxylesterase
VTAPTLIIQGSDDDYGTLAQVYRIAGAVAGPAQRLVVGGGHSLHLERTDEVVAAITEFAAALA